MLTQQAVPRASKPRTNSLSTDEGLLGASTTPDYFYADSVSSPGGSSTASGPTYARPAGFEHHAQEIIVSKSKSSTITAAGTEVAIGLDDRTVILSLTPNLQQL